MYVKDIFCYLKDYLKSNEIIYGRKCKVVNGN